MIRKTILDLIFPARCTFCDKVLSFGRRFLCEECGEKIKMIDGPTCMKCGKAVKEDEEYCYDCTRKKHEFIRGAALFEYDFVRRSLYRYKYGGRQEYKECYAKFMAHFLKDKITGWHAQALVPVPLHKERKRQRGYNQAEILAEELSKYLYIPVIKNLVIRSRKTLPMKDIEGSERQNNLKKAFLIGRNDVKLDTIIIIDDIYTTGSTIDEVRRVCKEAGIRNIYFLTVSIGHGF